MQKRKRWAPVLSTFMFLFTFFGLAERAAYADVSLSAIGMGHGAPSPEAFAKFQAVARRYNASGERFRIDTHCPSACTMFLGIRNVCIAPGATLAFHAGGSPARGVNPHYTKQMLNTYNGTLRRYLTSNHYMDRFEFHTISGADLIKRFGYRPCT